jgi:hypothetical protein
MTRLPRAGQRHSPLTFPVDRHRAIGVLAVIRIRHRRRRGDRGCGQEAVP